MFNSISAISHHNNFEKVGGIDSKQELTEYEITEGKIAESSQVRNFMSPVNSIKEESENGNILEENYFQSNAEHI